MAGSSTTSSSPLRTRHSVARRSEIRSWCGLKAVVGQRFPVGEQRHAQPGREEGQLVHQALRVGRVGGDDAQQLPGVARAPAHGGPAAGRRPSRWGGAGREALAAGDGRQLHGRCGQTQNAPQRALRGDRPIVGRRRQAAWPQRASGRRCPRTHRRGAGTGGYHWRVSSKSSPAADLRAARCFALVPCAGVGERAGAGTAQAVRPHRRRAPWWRTRWRRWPRCRACRPRWWCWRRATRSSRRTPGLPRRARLGGALRRRHARGHGGQRAGRAAATRRPRRRLGAGARRRALPVAARMGRPADRCLPGRRRRRPAGAAAGRHAQAGARRPRRAHAWSAATSGQRRRRRCSAWACCSTRWPGPAMPSPTRPARSKRCGHAPLLVQGELENFKLTWPQDLALAARLLRRAQLRGWPHEHRPAHRRRLGHACAGGRPAADPGRRAHRAQPWAARPFGCRCAGARHHRRAVRRGRAGRHRPAFPRHRRRASRAPIRWRCWPRPRAACALPAGTSSMSTAPSSRRRRRWRRTSRPCARASRRRWPSTPGCVNVKAKTAEKMGPVGEGRAIEARAVCLLQRLA